MSPVLSATLLLVGSNVFMTFAWYAHLKNLADRPWYLAAVASWGIAFCEYLLQVPGNRIGYTQLSLPQLIAAREGRDPRVIARLFSGWAVFGERQFVRGYSVLLPDPVVPNLNALGAQERMAFLSDMSRLGDALLKVAGAVRINYAIFGNQEAALHAHVIPRYVDEPEEMRGQQPWAYNWSAAPSFDRLSCQQLAEGLLRELTRMGVTKPMRYTPGANAEG